MYFFFLFLVYFLLFFFFIVVVVISVIIIIIIIIYIFSFRLGPMHCWWLRWWWLWGPSIKYVTLEGEGVREGVPICVREGVKSL